LLFYKKVSALSGNSIRNRLITGSFWSLSGSLVSRGFSALAVIGVARSLGTSAFGELGIVQTSINMFGAFATFGMAPTLIKHLAEFRNSDPIRAGRIMSLAIIVTVGISVFLSGLLFFLAPWLSHAMLNNPGLADVLRLAAFLLLFQCILEIQMGIMSGFEGFKLLSLSTAIQAILYGFCAYTGAVLYDLQGAVMGNILAFFILVLLNSFLIKAMVQNARINMQWRHSFMEIPILYRFSLPIALSGLISAPLRWFCSVILVNIPGGYFQMGLYQAAFRIRTLIMIIGDSISRPLLSLLSTIEGSQSIALQKTNLIGVWFIGVAFTFPFISFPEILDLLFGDAFAGREFRQTTVLVSMTLNLFICQQAIFRIFISQGLTWFRFLYQIFLSITILAGVYLLSPYGAVGYAGAFFLGKLLFFLFALFYCRRLGLVPPNSIFSMESLFIWCALFAASGASLCEFPISLRLVMDFILLALSVWCALRLLSGIYRSTGNEKQVACA
jgi:O-antigen/teichoic acid export membrane protein